MFRRSHTRRAVDTEFSAVAYRHFPVITAAVITLLLASVGSVFASFFAS